MKIFLFGATGTTGLKLTEQALSAGHQVTVYVRNPEKLGALKDKVKIIQGELTDEQKILESMSGQEAIIMALGYRTFKDSSQFLSKTAATVVKGMQQHGISKLVYLSAYGIGGKDSVTNSFLRFVLKSFGLIKPFKDHFISEKIIRQSNLDWTLARPGRLTDDKALGTYRAEVGLKGFFRISRADVANFMLDAVSNPKWSKKAVDLGY